MPKGDRFDWLVEKATELGVERLIPIVTERSVVEPGGPKLERLRRAIIEASKQCRRNRLMILDPPVRWDQLAGFIPTRSGSSPTRKEFRSPQWPAIPPAQSVILAVGPEGGFTPQERSDGRPERVACDQPEFHAPCGSRPPDWPAVRPCSRV